MQQGDAQKWAKVLHASGGVATCVQLLHAGGGTAGGKQPAPPHPHDAWLTVDMLKPSTLSAGMAVRVK